MLLEGFTINDNVVCHAAFSNETIQDHGHFLLKNGRGIIQYKWQLHKFKEAQVACRVKAVLYKDFSFMGTCQ